MLTAEVVCISIPIIPAARLLGISKNTLQQRAKAGIIPGAKIGRCWTFIESDLVAYLRSNYPDPLCPSTNAKTRRSGGSTSRTQACHEYVSQLEQIIAKKRNASTTK